MIETFGSTPNRIVQIAVPGDPKAQARGRAVRRGNYVSVIDDPKSRSHKAYIQDVAARLWGNQPPLDCEVWLEIVCKFQLPRSKWRKREPVNEHYHMARQDADNLAKAVMDALNGVVYLDDRQVVSLTVQKLRAAQGEPSETLVQIAWLDQGEA